MSLTQNDLSLRARLAFARGEHHAAAGDVDGAIFHFRAALETTDSKARIATHEQLASIFLKLNRANDAILHLRAVSDVHGSDPKYVKLLARALDRSGQTEQAIAAWREVLRLSPESQAAHERLAELLQKEGRPRDAVNHVRALAIAMQPKKKGSVRLARLLETVGESDAAVEAWRDVLALDSSDRETHQRLAALLEARNELVEALPHLEVLATPDDSDKSSRMRYANALELAGEADRAINAWRAVLAVAPDNTEGHKHIAGLLESAGRKEECIAHLRVLANRLVTQGHFRARLARMLEEIGDQDAAMIAWSAVTIISPTNAEAHGRLAVLLEGKGRASEALPHLRVLANSAPNRPKLLRRLARLLDKLGDAEAALEVWRSLLSPAETDLEAMSGAVSLLARLDRRQEAIHLLQTHPSPTHLPLWKFLAHSANEAMDVDGEIAIWESVLTAVPNDLDAHERLAILLVRSGRSADAGPHFSALEARAREARSARKRLVRASATRRMTEGLPEAKFHYVPDIYGRSASKLVDIRSDERFRTLAEKARAEGRTLLYFDRLFSLYEAVANLARRTSAGAPLRLLEVGVYRGGSSYFLASVVAALIEGPIEQFAVDTFAGHAAEDIPGGLEGAHTAGLFHQVTCADVTEYLSVFPSVQVVQARIQDAVDALGGEFAFIHLDTDIYAPTRFTLEHFAPNMPDGAIVVVDDYGFVTCPGVRKAVNEYLEAHPGRFLKFELQTGQCLLIKSEVSTRAAESVGAVRPPDEPVSPIGKV